MGPGEFFRYGEKLAIRYADIMSVSFPETRVNENLPCRVRLRANHEHNARIDIPLEAGLLLIERLV